MGFKISHPSPNRLICCQVTRKKGEWRGGTSMMPTARSASGEGTGEFSDSHMAFGDR